MDVRIVSHRVLCLCTGSAAAALLTLICLAISTVRLPAQNVVALRELACARQCPEHQQGGAGAASGRNPWFLAGVKIGRNLAGPGDFPDEVIGSGLLHWKLISAENADSAAAAMADMEARRGALRMSSRSKEGYGLILLANADKPDADAITSPEKVREKLLELASGDEGLRVSLQPYFETRSPFWQTNLPIPFVFVFYGGAGYKLNAATDTATEATSYLHQLRFSAGTEVLFYGANAAWALPLTISIEPLYSILRESTAEQFFGAEFSARRASIEATIVLPLWFVPKVGVGLLGQVIATKDTSPGWRASMLILP